MGLGVWGLLGALFTVKENGTGKVLARRGDPGTKVCLFKAFLSCLSIPRESFKTSGGEQRMTPHLAGQGGTEKKLQW